ncbi:hypothetical protein PF011_g8925 [Phytophthora fragariae]|uniref:Uncharacterized protein n=1 Tax=Phytophthora fragariae TaxID=53985 RepID=A0A6A3L948_9STRA|nr:hypothetical protein PF011_g8925 [Phytophthora fragariae]
MTASSQGDDEDEERRALERELAEELALLSAQDVGFDECASDGDDQRDESISSGEIEMNYVRLDIDRVLQEVGEVELPVQQGTDQEVLPTAWELLLLGIKRIDREFFQPIREDLHDIRTTILDVKPSSPELTLNDSAEQSQIPDKEVNQTRSDNAGSLLESTIGSALVENNMGEIQAPFAVHEKETITVTDSVEEQRTDSVGAKPASSEPSSVDHSSESPNVSSLVGVFTSSLSDKLNGSTIDAEQKYPTDDNAAQRKLDALTKQQEARESRRLKIQARHQKERDEAANFLRQLKEEFEAQEKSAEAARQEALERSIMASEEARSRIYAWTVREVQETALMVIADEDSRSFAVELARARAAICKEVARMTIEDRVERQRMQFERQVLHQKQETLARCHFGTVLSELVNYHQTLRQIRDQQSKRERRECVQMRAEEAYTRRIIGETLAQRELQAREQNRALMMHEDESARAMEELERTRELQTRERLRELECCRCMEEEEKRCHSAWSFIDSSECENEELCQMLLKQEEERCRSAWAYLAKVAEEEAKERDKLHRLRMLANVSAGFQGLDRVFQQHQLVACLEKWKWWFMQRLEEDRQRFMTTENAAKTIQMWHRSCRRRQEELVVADAPLVLEDFSDDELLQDEDEGTDNEGLESVEYQEAALRLQSTFRGFHVRRKFANALALAQAVGGPEEGDTFDGVDLDDLIQLPPELVDGWEDPVLPTAVTIEQRQYLPPLCAGYEEERPECVDNNEVEDSCKNVSTSPVDNNAPKEQNLAATLWNKMKRVKQRQQHAQQERKRQQDPSYRVQKLLNRKPTDQTSNQNGYAISCNQSSRPRMQTPQGAQKVSANLVSWSSTSSQKKKPKVKLPSLVERLRRQTMAER